MLVDDFKPSHPEPVVEGPMWTEHDLQLLCDDPSHLVAQPTYHVANDTALATASRALVAKPGYKLKASTTDDRARQLGRGRLWTLPTP